MSQGSVYTAFIEGQVKAEYERRAALEARGIGVITSSGAFTTLLFGVVALVKGKDFAPAVLTQLLLAAAVLALIVAGALGLWANQLIAYRVAKPATLTAMVTTHWGDSEVSALNACAVANIDTLETLRDGSNKKAGRITLALWAQLGAFVLIGLAALVEVVC